MKRLPIIITAAALSATLGLGSMQPAKADQASTTETILAAAAAIAGIAISQNVAHKQQQAQTVVGRTAYGATVYADGHVVLPDGRSYYPGNYGQRIACNGTFCSITGPNSPFGPYGYNGYGYPTANSYPNYAYPRVVRTAYYTPPVTRVVTVQPRTVVVNRYVVVRRHHLRRSELAREGRFQGRERD
jgi:hypothetical protein